MRPISSRPVTGSAARRFAASYGEHALAYSRKAREKIAIDIQPNNQHRAQQGEEGRAKDNSGPVMLDGCSFEAGYRDVSVRRSD
jgi:hypothetical protein